MKHVNFLLAKRGTQSADERWLIRRLRFPRALDIFLKSTDIVIECFHMVPYAPLVARVTMNCAMSTDEI